MLLDANYTGGIWLPILISLAIGAVLGAFNGIFVGYFGLPALIVTLGSSSVFKGFMQGTLASRQLAVIPEGMAAFGRSAIFVATNPESGLTSRMPMAFLVFVAVVAVAWFILNRTMFGRGIYAIGGNENCAKLSGINLNKVKCFVYVISGLCCGVAAILLTSRLDSAVPTNADGQEMDAIAAVVIGVPRSRGRGGSPKRSRKEARWRWHQSRQCRSP